MNDLPCIRRLSLRLTERDIRRLDTIAKHLQAAGSLYVDRSSVMREAMKFTANALESQRDVVA